MPYFPEWDVLWMSNLVFSEKGWSVVDGSVSPGEYLGCVNSFFPKWVNALSDSLTPDTGYLGDYIKNGNDSGNIFDQHKICNVVLDYS